MFAVESTALECWMDLIMRWQSVAVAVSISVSRSLRNVGYGSACVALLRDHDDN
jgi:hypothetical protein